jgi:hypothetical protein
MTVAAGFLERAGAWAAAARPRSVPTRLPRFMPRGHGIRPLPEAHREPREHGRQQSRERSCKVCGTMNSWVVWVVRAAVWSAAYGCADAESRLSPQTDVAAGPWSACTTEGAALDSAAAEPRPLLVGSTLEGRACAHREDAFLLDTAEHAGALLRVEVAQLGGRGELDAHVAALAGGERFPSQAPQGVARRDISFVAAGDAYVLRVLLVDLPAESSPGRGYAVSLRDVPRSNEDCCVSGAGPGCADDGVLACLCQLDNACCGGAYDTTCVAEARSSCSLHCGSDGSVQDCCTPSTAGGCSEPGVPECVCDIDPYCCAGGFDENCVNLATQRCGAACPASSKESR